MLLVDASTQQLWFWDWTLPIWVWCIHDFPAGGRPRMPLRIWWLHPNLRILFACSSPSTFTQPGDMLDRRTRNMFEMCGGKGEGISYWPWWFQQNPKTIAFNLRCQIRLWLPCCLFSQVFQAQEFSPDCFGSVLHVGGWCATGLYHCLVPGCQRPLQPKVSNTMRSWEAEAELSLKSKANTWTEQNVVLISVNQTIFQEWHQVMQSSNVRRLSVVIRLGS